MDPIPANFQGIYYSTPWPSISGASAFRPLPGAAFSASFSTASSLVGCSYPRITVNRTNTAPVSSQSPRNYKSWSLILLMLISMTMLILPFTSVSTSTIGLPISLSGSSYDSAADLQMGRRMDIETEDYSEAGANNRHDPPPPTPTLP